MQPDPSTPEEAAPWDLLSNALGSLDEIEESDESLALDVREQSEGGGEGQADPYRKVPLEHAANLIKLQNAAAGVLSGSLTTEEYMDILRPMQKALESGIKLIESEAVASQIAALPEEQRTLFLETQSLVGVLLDGVRHMSRYKESANPDDVRDGLASIEAAFQELDEVQDEAIDLGRELDAEEPPEDDE